MTNEQIRVMVVDDHPLMIEAVRLVLDDVDDIKIVGTAASGKELLDTVRTLAPDVVLLDLRMPGIDGLTCLDRLRERRHSTKVVILSALDDQRLIAEALARGAHGYVVKTVDPCDLASAIRLAIDGTVFTRRAPAAQLDALDRLTARERMVLGALARGLSNREIAHVLVIGDQTVKFHVTNIYDKLGFTNRAQAACFGFTHGLAAAHAVED